MSKSTSENLTAKQEAFAVEYIMNGRDASAAYRKVYDTKTDNDTTVWVNSHKVRTNTKVSLRIHQLEMAEFAGEILTIKERKELLSRWAKDGNDKAVDLLNKMEGVYVDKVKLETVEPVQYYAPKRNKDN